MKLTEIDDFFYESCPLGKSHRLPFKKNGPKRNAQPGEIIHTDVCGSMSTESPVVQDSL